MRDHDESEDVVIERIAQSLRAPESLHAAFDNRVMAAIRADAVQASRPGVWQWLVQPRPIRLSPLAGFAMAASLVAITVTGVTLGRSTDGGASATATAGAPGSGDSTQKVVQFVFVAPHAARVSVVGDFNDWDPVATPLVRTVGNVWVADVPLPPGRYTYTFVVDGGEWIPDPLAPRAAGDGFGHPNSLLTVEGVGT